MAEDENPIEEDDIPTRKSECRKSPNVGAQLSEMQKGQLLKLLHEFKSVMSGKCGRTTICQHHIHTKEILPIQQCSYQIPHMFREIVEEEIRTMLEEGMIEPSNSEWASPMVIIKKKDDTLKLCADYRS